MSGFLFQFVSKPHLGELQIEVFEYSVLNLNFELQKPIRMIKPIVLLVAATCLALLDQSNSEQTPTDHSGRRFCPNLYYACVGTERGHVVTFHNVCVRFKPRGQDCVPTWNERRIHDECVRERPGGVVFTNVRRSTAECWIN